MNKLQIQDWLIQWLKQNTQDSRLSENIDANLQFYHLKISTKHLSQAIKNQWNIDLYPDEIFSYPTPLDLSQYMVNKWQRTLECTQIQTGVFKPYEPIAVIGMSCRFPGNAETPEAFWEILYKNVDAITEVPKSRWDIDSYYDPNPKKIGKMYTRFGGFINDIDIFDASFFRISPKEAAVMDPQQKIVLQAAWHALEHAAINPLTLRGSRTGVYIGIYAHDYDRLIQKNQLDENITAYHGTGNTYGATAGRISYFLGLRGPSMVTDTACSSALTALHQACQSLQSGETEIALAGGINLLLDPQSTICYCRARMMAADGRCKTFDEKANGFVRSEGCGVVVLKKLVDAKRAGDRILAVIKSSVVNQDGASNGLTAPSGEAQALLLKEALMRARLQPQDIDYFEAHGTGTSLGDPIEVRALNEVYQGSHNDDQPLYIGSVKSVMGHAEGAAGVSGLIKVILSLQQETIPANLHFNKVNPLIDLSRTPLKVPTENIPWERDKHHRHIRRAAVSAYGFIGTNAHVILEEAPEIKRTYFKESKTDVDRPLHLITLSAQTPEALTQSIKNLIQYFKAHPKVSLADAAYTLNTGRMHFKNRLAVIASDVNECVEKLKNEKIHTAKNSLDFAKLSYTKETGWQVISAPDTSKAQSKSKTEKNKKIKQSRQESSETQSGIAHSKAWQDLKEFISGKTCINLKMQDWQNLWNQVKELYLQGVDFDWKSLEGSYLSYLQKITLPGYPFQGKRFWIEKTKFDELRGQTHFLHPYVGATYPLPDSGIAFHVQLSLKQQPELKDHKIMSYILFPAAGCIELCLYTAESLFKTRQIHIESLSIQKPLELNDKYIDLYIHAINAGAERYQLKLWIKSVHLDEWESYAEAFISPISPQKTTKDLHTVIPKIYQQIPHFSNKDNFYKKLSETGLSYGINFKVITEVKHAQDKEYALLQDKDKQNPPFADTQYLFYPPLLDGYLQVLTQNPGEPNKVYLPVSFKHIYFYGNVTETLYAEIKRIPNSSQTVHGHVTLVNESGQIVFEAKETIMRAVTPAILRQNLIDTYHSQWFYHLDWKQLRIETLQHKGPLEKPLYWIGTPPSSFPGPESKNSQEKIYYYAKGLLNDAHETSFPKQFNKNDTIIIALSSRTDTPEAAVQLCMQLIKICEHIRSLKNDAWPRIYVITKNASANLQTDNIVHLAYHSLFALIKSMAKEWTRSRISVIDVDDEMFEKQFSLIQKIILSQTDEHLIACRQDKLYVPRLHYAARSEYEKKGLLFPKVPHYYLHIENKGEIDSLILKEKPQNALKDNEVEVAVKASGVNFRDVLNALGLYPKNAGPLGIEGAGIIAQRGKNVKDFKIGDEVFGLMSGSLANRVIVHEACLVKKPKFLSMQEAAALPIVFMTAWFTLHEIAKLKAQDKVLIHLATGGVGLAAIQIAQSVGAEIYATASEGKHSYLKELGVKHIYNSRTLNYGEQILEDTRKKGVDVVLNSLSGQGYINTTLGCCAKNARFIEIGKRGIWTQEKMKSTRPDVFYEIVALDEIAKENPHKIRELLQQLVKEFKNNTLHVPPLRMFGLQQVKLAFNYLKEAKHIGKVVINEMQKPYDIHAGASYLVTGGLGGLGKQLIQWLIGKGAGRIFLIGRSALSNDKENWLKNLATKHTELEYLTCDIAKQNEVTKLFSHIEATTLKQKLRGIFHLAGILEDAPLERQTQKTFLDVFHPKARGAYLLHEASKNLNLDYFVCFSSITSLFGRAGQANYAAANAYVDGLISLRLMQGLCAQSIQWGPWAEVGMAHGFEKDFSRQGFEALLPQEAIEAFDHSLSRPQGILTIALIHWHEYFQNVPKLQKQPWLDAFKAKTYQSATPEMQKFDELSYEEKNSRLKRTIHENVEKIIGIEAVQDDVGFTDMGLDSIMAIDLKNQLQQYVGDKVQLSSTIAFDYPTVERLTAHIAEELKWEQEAKDSIKVEEKIMEEKSLEKKNELVAATPHALFIEEPIAIIGMSCRFPGGADTPERFWEKLKEGYDAITEIPKERFDIDAYYNNDKNAPGKITTRYGAFLNHDIKKFDAEFFNIAPKEAVYLDPQQRLLLEVSYEALENAGMAPIKLRNSKAGVFVGICNYDYSHLIQKYGSEEAMNAYYATGNYASTAAGRISYCFGLRGPSIPIDTACSSSLVAIDTACNHLKNQNCDLAVVGGVNLLLTPELFINFSKAGMLSADGRCKTFDEKANGYVRGEGCGVIILKRLSQAKADNDNILALIQACGVNQDGASGGLTVPNGEAQKELLRQVLKRSGFKANDVDYIEAHGTGTSLGDPIEVHAIAKVYGKNRDKALKIGSVKTNIGHLEAAAGMASIIKTALALQHQQLPATIHFKKLNPKINLKANKIHVNETITDWKITSKNNEPKKPRIAAISSFGFSGTNAHVILSGPEDITLETTRNQTAVPEREIHLVTLSAQTETALNQHIENHIHYLKHHPESNLADIAYSLNTGRVAFNCRAAVTANNINELIEGLTQADIKTINSMEKIYLAVLYHENSGFNIHIQTLPKPIQKKHKQDLLALERLLQHQKAEAIQNTSWKSIYHHLAQLYLSGVDIDWEGLESPFKLIRNKIALPTYPFAHQSYWVEKKEKTADRTGLSQVVHPLLGTRQRLAHPTIITYEQELDLKNIPFLGDHIVYEEIIFPAAGFVELLCAAGQEQFRGTCSIEEFVIEKPLFLDEKTSVHIQVVLQRENDAYKACIYSQKIQGIDQGAWEYHAGAILKSEPEGQPNYISMNQITNILDGVKKQDIKKIYGAFKQQGLHYKKSFQGYNGSFPDKEGESNVHWGLLNLSQNLSENAVQYYIHPVLLDSSFHVLLPLLESHMNGKCVYLPVSIEKLKYYSPLSKQNLVRAEIKDLINNRLCADLQIYNELGECCVEIKHLTLRQTNKENLLRRLRNKEIDISWHYGVNFIPQPLSIMNTDAINNVSWLWIDMHKKTSLFESFNATGITCEEVALSDSHTMATLENKIKTKNPKGIILDLIQDTDNHHLKISLSALLQKNGLDILLLTAQAVNKFSDIAIYVLTKNSLLCGNSVNLPGSPISGFIRSWNLEEPHRKIVQIDWDSHDKTIDISKNLLLELAQNDNETQIAYRDHKRYTARFNRWQDYQIQKKILLLPEQNYRIVKGKQTGIEHLQVLPLEEKHLSPHQIRIKVSAAGLNFRDVLNAMGMYPGEAGALGGEFSGTILEKGSSVSNFRKRDKVFGFAQECFADTIITHENLIMKQPVSITETQAAAAPIVYVTAYAALVSLAKLKKRENVLIHTGAGGVGFAAIQISKHIGANIFVTASKPKHSYLRNMGIKHIYDSRNTDYAKEIQKDTNQKGVAVVLNTLTGPGFIEATLGVCQQHARFIEISKINVFSMTTMKKQRPDIAYHIFALDDLIQNDLKQTHSLLKAVAEEIAARNYEIVSPKTFMFPQTPKAFQTLQSGEVIGKIVLTPPGAVSIKNKATYIVTGGLGGIGLSLAQWLHEKGAGHIILIARSKPDENVQKIIQEIKAEVINFDISDDKALNNFVSSYIQNQPEIPIKGIFHLAGVLEDSMLNNQNMEKFKKVFLPKAIGAWNLHQTMIQYNINLDYFVLFSSITSQMGAAGQTNYAAANAFLDALAHFRKLQGHTALCINWGAWGETGMATRLKQFIPGIIYMPAKSALRNFELLLSNNGINHCIVANLNWKTLEKRLSTIGLFKSFITTSTKADLLGRLKNSSEGERDTVLTNYLYQKLSAVLNLNPNTPLNDKKGFFDLGMDSLTAVEFRNVLQSDFGNSLNIPNTIAFDYPSIIKIKNFILEKLGYLNMKNKQPDNESEETTQIQNLKGSIDDMTMDEAIQELESLRDFFKEKKA